MDIFTQQWIEKWMKKNKPKKFLLWVDDLRPVPNNYIGEYEIVIARCYDEAIIKLHSMHYDVICLDHDLGEVKTGYDICKHIIENNIHCPEYRIHTSNPVGRDNMSQLLRRYTKSLVRLG